MNQIAITVTGHLGSDPRSFTTHSNRPGVELSLAIDLPARTPGGDGFTRWVKVVAFDLLASNVAASLSQGELVTVVADDFRADTWVDRASGEARGRVVLVASDVTASMRRDTLRTGFAARKAARTAAANGQPSDLDGGEQADMRVLNGITA